MSEYAKPQFEREYVPAYFNGVGWRVVNRKGEVIGEVFPSKQAAAASAGIKNAAADRARKRMDRPCMCCGQVFASAGIGNRLCTTCRGRASADMDPHGYSFGAMTGRRRSA